MFRSRIRISKQLVLLALPILAMTISSCLIMGQGVVTAVETHYVQDRKKVLSISGQTASHPLYGLFQIDDPPMLGKRYLGDEGTSLEFSHDGSVMIATIVTTENETEQFVFLAHGGSRKASGIGFFKTIHAEFQRE